MKKAKRTSVFVIAFLVVISLSVALTLAFLTDKTEKRKNTFTIGNGVKIQLEEPLYDLNTKGYQYSPNEVLDKDPTVVIPSDAMEKEYIAAVVEYYIDKDGDGAYESKISYNEFRDYASIGSIMNEIFISDQPQNGWFSVDNNETFFYGKGGNDKIEALVPVENGNKYRIFDKVKINANVPRYKENTKKYIKNQPVAFRIDVIAYAVQGNVEDKDAINAMAKKFNLNIGKTFSKKQKIQFVNDRSYKGNERGSYL